MDFIFILHWILFYSAQNRVFILFCTEYDLNFYSALNMVLSLFCTEYGFYFILHWIRILVYLNIDWFVNKYLQTSNHVKLVRQLDNPWK